MYPAPIVGEAVLHKHGCKPHAHQYSWTCTINLAILELCLHVDQHVITYKAGWLELHSKAVIWCKLGDVIACNPHLMITTNAHKT